MWTAFSVTQFENRDVTVICNINKSFLPKAAGSQRQEAKFVRGPGKASGSVSFEDP